MLFQMDQNGRKARKQNKSTGFILEHLILFFNQFDFIYRLSVVLLLLY